MDYTKQMKLGGWLKMKKKKLISMVAALMICVMGVSVPASAKSVNTTEFGKFTWTLVKSGNEVTANTKCEKAANKLITNLTIQINATGETIANVSKTAENATNCKKTTVVNRTGVNLACFSCHEARGKGSITKYLAEVF